MTHGMGDTITVGRDLTLDDVIAVACHHARVELAVEAREKMEASRAWVEQVLARGAPTVYGINTGFGVFANVPISSSQAQDLMHRLIISHAAGVGEPLDEAAVRATLLIRAQSLAQGYSGVRVAIVETLIEMLNRGVHPVIPSQGSVGASGDLAPLAHMSLVLTTAADEKENESGLAIYQGERLSGRAAMERAGIPRLVLLGKEGLALTNGATVSTALACLALADADNLAAHAQVAVALTLEAVRGVSHAYDERVHRAHRHRSQQRVAGRIRGLVDGSRLIDSTPRVQDAYSLRCAPQVIGAAMDALDHARQILGEEINAATDNPLVFPDLDDEIKSRSAGNFHGAPVALVADMVAIAASLVSAQSERRIYRLCDAKLNDGLPMMLVEGGGLNSGFMMAQVTAAALVSENKTLAHPDSVDSIPTSGGQEDHVPMAMNAALHARRVVWNSQTVVAIELIAAAQGIDLRLKNMGQPARILGQGTRRAWERIRVEIPYLERDRLMSLDIERALELVRHGELLRL